MTHESDFKKFYAKRNHYQKESADLQVDLFVDTLKEFLCSNGEVRLYSFGIFTLMKRKGHVAGTLVEGEKTYCKPYFTVSFRLAPRFKRFLLAHTPERMEQDA